MLFRSRWIQPESVELRQQRLRTLPDREITARALGLKDQVLDCQPEAAIVADLFPLVREAARRRLGIEHRGNQIDAGRRLLGRTVVELPTGEGKTLAATLALAFRALFGHGAWLATANDYLAYRDASTMSGLFELLGLRVGFLRNKQSSEERRVAYQADIVYGTIREFGFDYLRDRLTERRLAGRNASHRHLLQRELYSIIVDEADSILLDEARTPLIISEPQGDAANEALFRWSVETGRRLKDEVDYFVSRHP